MKKLHIPILTLMLLTLVSCKQQPQLPPPPKLDFNSGLTMSVMTLDYAKQVYTFDGDNAQTIYDTLCALEYQPSNDEHIGDTMIYIGDSKECSYSLMTVPQLSYARVLTQYGAAELPYHDARVLFEALDAETGSSENKILDSSVYTEDNAARDGKIAAYTLLDSIADSVTVHTLAGDAVEISHTVDGKDARSLAALLGGFEYSDGYLSGDAAYKILHGRAAYYMSTDLTEIQCVGLYRPTDSEREQLQKLLSKNLVKKNSHTTPLTVAFQISDSTTAYYDINNDHSKQLYGLLSEMEYEEKRCTCSPNIAVASGDGTVYRLVFEPYSSSAHAVTDDGKHTLTEDELLALTDIFNDQLQIRNRTKSSSVDTIWEAVAQPAEIVDKNGITYTFPERDALYLGYYVTHKPYAEPFCDCDHDFEIKVDGRSYKVITGDDPHIVSSCGQFSISALTAEWLEGHMLGQY